MTPLLRFVISPLLLAGLAAGPIVPAAPTAAVPTIPVPGVTVLDIGHVDIASVLTGGALATAVKDDTTGAPSPVFHDLADVVFHVKPSAEITVPVAPEYAFLGPPGSAVWNLPATQNEDLLWPGWSTELIPAGALHGGVTWSLTDVSGPGEFALFESGDFGAPAVRFDSRDGISAADSFAIAQAVHAHGNWAFSAEGVYCLAFTRSATLAQGGAQSVDSVLAVAVGDTDPHAVDPAECFVDADGKPDDADTSPPAPEELAPTPSGGITITGGESGFAAGQLVTVEVGERFSGSWVSPWLHSTGVWLGWTQVDASGIIQVRVPAGTVAGAHSLVVSDRDGAMLGWTTLTVVSPPAPPPAVVVPPNSTPTTPTKPTPPSVRVPATQCVAGSTVLSSGHVDYASRIVDGRLQSLIKDGTGATPVWREPSNTILWAKPSSRRTLPAGYAAIGAAGATIWQIPQTQDADLVWLGWNTESISSSAASGPVSWTLNSVSGPGTAKVYLQGSFSEIKSVVFNGSGRHTIDLGRHVHANWAFSAQGIYRMSFTQSVTLANGRVTSDTETLTIAVGDVDPATAAGGSSGCAAVTSAELDSTDATDAAKAAEQAAALAAAADDAGAAPSAGADSPAVDTGADDAAPAAEPTSSVVPMLLTVLGGLILLGAVGAGVVLARRRPSR